MADVKKSDPKQAPQKKSGLTGLQRVLLWALAIVLVVSVLARLLLDHGGETELANGMRAAAHAGENAVAQPAGSFEALLPYVTEGSLFGLIGFALGYATRKVFKIGLILIAVAFVGVQVGVHMGWMSVDWNGLTEALNRFVLNLKEDETVTKFLTNRVPSVAALVAGTVVGFQRG